MRQRGFVLILALGVLCAFSPQAEEAPKPEILVQKLGSDDFDERQEAAEKLEALGEAARTALEKARRSEVLEVRATAFRLLSLLKHAKLNLQIVDEKGKPWPEFAVTASLQPYAQGRQLQMMVLARGRANQNEAQETDAAGNLELLSPAPGLHNLSVSWQESQWYRSTWQPHSLNLRSGENRAFWIRPRGATVTGTVVAEETGKPVADAEVLVRRDDGTRLSDLVAQWLTGQNATPNTQGTTDAKGAFSLQNVGPSSARVYVRHAEYIPTEGPLLTVTDPREYAMGQPIRLQLKSKAWGRVRAHVLNDAGKPTENAKVQVHLSRIDAPDPMQSSPNMIWQRRQRERQALPLDTDKNGWVQTDYLEPGTYQLSVTGGADDANQNESQRTAIYGSVEVKAGETTSVEGRTPPKMGMLTGRFKSTDELRTSPLRVLALRTDEPAVQQYLSQGDQIQPWALYQFLEDNRNQQYIHANKEDFEFNNLQPGHYALVLQSMRDQQFGWIFGLEVKPGETTTIPEIDLESVTEAEELLQPRTLSGVLLDDKGRILNQVQWTVRGPGFSSSSTTNGGNFQIDLRNNGKPTTLVFTCAGYRPFKIDLRKPIANPEQMVVQLQRQGYGAVQVTVHDPDGRPLEDARITPVSAVNRMPSFDRSRDTGQDGRTKLPGLAYGKRRLVVELEEYYLDTPLMVDVELDKIVELDVTMKPGVVLKGHVTIPADVPPEDVLVWVACSESPLLNAQQEFWRSTGVTAAGDFEFPGLAPGKAKLKAQAPGMISDEITATVGSDERIDLKLQKPACMVIDIGDAGKGGTLWLMKPGSLKPSQNIYSLLKWSTPVDTNGRAVFGDLAPGTYDLVYAAKLGQLRNVRGQASMQIIAPAIEISAEKTTVLKIDRWSPGKANVTVLPSNKDADPSEGFASQSLLLLESPAAFAMIYAGQNSPSRTTKPWFVRGTPPEGFLSAKKADGLSIDGLPAGEYKLHVCTRSFQSGRGQPIDQPPRLVKTFTLKDGESLDLGTVELEAPANPESEAETSGEEIGEDEPLEP